ncbi:hypothetical protein ACQR1I_35405 [Bradyrhizobium sp. HKCCYLS2038]|uniref:hypothetical protein n=1 Tax=unclassified Bradyrhizobium TaxID=2631580 RepID=UPI003EB97BA3
MTNDPQDLQILHEVVCRAYGEFRAEGGQAETVYLPLFWQFSSALEAAKASETSVSPTIVVLRPDGSQGVIDLVELFTQMEYLA